MFQREVDSSVELSRHDDDDRQVGNGEIDVAVSTRYLANLLNVTSFRARPE